VRAGGAHAAHSQSRAYTPVSSSYGGRESPERSSLVGANGYDSDGVYNGAPATTAAHHASAGTARWRAPTQALPRMHPACWIRLLSLQVLRCRLSSTLRNALQKLRTGA
jgi:hypothetical protein